MNQVSFKARTIQEALEQVRQTLGPDAIILATHSHLEKGLLGGTQQRFIEVQACKHEDTPSGKLEINRQPVDNRLKRSSLEQVVTANSYIDQLYQQERATLEAEQRQRQLLRQERPEEFVPASITHSLLHAGIELELVRRILRAIPEGTQDTSLAVEIHRELQKIVVPGTMNFSSSNSSRAKPLVIVLVGRSGSGRSTLATKLATQCELRDEMPAAVIELTGTNRQQHFWMHLHLQSLGIRSAQVENTNQLLETVQHFHDCAAVFIDTPAFSFNPQQTAMLNATVRQLQPDYCLIAHDAQTRHKSTHELVRAFEQSCPALVALTKTDEEKPLGHLVSLFHQIQLPVTLLSHSAALADGFTMMTKSKYSELLRRMTGLVPEDVTSPVESVEAQDSFTLNFNSNNSI